MSDALLLLSYEMIEAGRLNTGQFHAEQLQALGLPKKPKNNWVAITQNTYIREDLYERFMSLKTKYDLPKEDCIVLTSDLIEAGRTKTGGFFKRQLETIGVKYPIQDSWFSDLIGKTVSKTNYEKFLTLKKNEIKHSKVPHVEVFDEDSQVILTRDMIMRGCTGKAGFTNNQLKTLGVFPAQKGWIDRLVGSSIPADQYQLYLDYKSGSDAFSYRYLEGRPHPGGKDYPPHIIERAKEIQRELYNEEELDRALLYGLN